MDWKRLALCTALFGALGCGDVTISPFSSSDDGNGGEGGSAGTGGESGNGGEGGEGGNGEALTLVVAGSSFVDWDDTEIGALLTDIESDESRAFIVEGEFTLRFEDVNATPETLPDVRIWADLNANSVCEPDDEVALFDGNFDGGGSVLILNITPEDGTMLDDGCEGFATP